MHYLSVAVLRGGPFPRYDTSIRTGGAILRHLSGQFRPHDILIDLEGVWYRNGIPVAPAEALRHADVAVNALHGTYEGAGKIQSLLDAAGVRYTGSQAVASAAGMHPVLVRKSLALRGIRMPFHTVLRFREEDIEAAARKLFLTFPQPSVVRPVSGGPLKAMLVHSAAEIAAALEAVSELQEDALIEEYIVGREAVCGVIDSFRNQALYALLPAEIIRTKLTGDTGPTGGQEAREICPGRFSRTEKDEIERIAKAVHAALGFRHYSRADFIVHPRRGVYLREVNPHPALAETVLFPKILDAAGISMPGFLSHVVGLAAAGK